MTENSGTVRPKYPANNYEAENYQLFNIYPNPASTELTLDYKGINNVKSICIYDITGRLLKKESVETSTTQKVIIESFENGIYFLVLLKENGERTTAKFVKN